MDSEDSPVDVSVLEALIRVRTQQDQVDQFCRKAEAMKDQVAQAVYERVVSDYEARRRTLEQEAAPLVTRALAEYRKLCALRAGVQRTHDAARLDKDEVEFRHSLGEIDDSTRTARLVAPDRILSESDAELAKLDAQDARFKEALPGVDLSAAAEAPETSERHEPAEPADEAEGESSDVEFVGPDEAAAAHQATVWLPEPTPLPGPALAAGDVEPPSAAAADAPALPGGQNLTLAEPFFIPSSGPGADVSVNGGGAALVSEADAGRSVNYQLTALTYIGRAEDNQIRILDPGISRRHVLITATPAGYTIRDLKSQNGTYLNGDRIDETTLADGDRITLGDVTLVFRRGGYPPGLEPGSAA